MAKIITTIWKRDWVSVDEHVIRQGYSAKEEVEAWNRYLEESRMCGRIAGYKVELRDEEDIQMTTAGRRRKA